MDGDKTQDGLEAALTLWLSSGNWSDGCHMDVRELLGLINWYKEFATPVIADYRELISVLDNNASNGAKQPVREPLLKVKTALLAMPVYKLSDEQKRLLWENEVSELVGREGWTHINKIVTDGSYDPASAAKDARSALSRIEAVRERFSQLTTAVGDLKIMLPSLPAEDGRATLRIHFEDASGINNTPDLKKWASDWNDIVSGIAQCVDEAPEETHVVGADTGTVIVILTATKVFTKLFAMIAKDVIGVAKQGLELANAWEDLKQKRLETTAMAAAFEAQRKALKDGGVTKVLENVKQLQLPSPLTPEKEGKLKLAIQKYTKFQEGGGSVDLLSPPDEVDIAAETDDDEVEGLSELNAAIEALRIENAEYKALIAHHPDGE